MQNNFT